ncbi:unnamed protein product [Lactuca saligna]|uniref:Uncharacterized protein n=1 Tax=Lactuca saligna TaxID=75948 RepID=A0AA35YE47_LACSI|nr:unnamed protein product [Lactuca saligna]
MHATFNVGDLSPYLDDDGLDELRSIPFKGGGDDPCMEHESPKGEFVERINLVIGEEIIEHSKPFYATDGEDDHEEVEEEIKFEVGNKIVETIVKEINFVVTNKIVEESEEVEQVLDHEDVVVVKKDDDTRLITNRLCKSLEEGVTIKFQVPSSYEGGTS